MERKDLSGNNLLTMTKIKSDLNEGLSISSRELSDLSLKNRSPKIQKVQSILKKTTRLEREYHSKDPSPESEKGKTQQGGVTWDTKVIDEQNNYRKLHPCHDKKKMKSESETKFKPVENSDDSYSKAFNNVNQMKVTDDLIIKVLNVLEEPNKSCYRSKNSKSPSSWNKKNLEKIYFLTEKEKLFGNDLEVESMRTLQNTMLNKFHKEIVSKNAN